VSRGTFDAAARRLIEAQIDGSVPPQCPECGAALTLTPVPTPAGVPYVRRRLLIVCGGCRRSATFDAMRT
jgi:hypothetical protein